MTQQLDDLLMSMTPMLNKLSRQPDSTFEYQGVCDGLVWSDEIPDVTLSDQQEQVLRYLVQYRTSQIVSEPISNLSELWNQARLAFPQWAGFAAGRCEPSSELSDYVVQARKKLEAFLEEES
jgi:hypothetical protein